MTSAQREMVRSVDRWALGAVHLPVAPLVAEKMRREWTCITKGHDWHINECRRCGKGWGINEIFALRQAMARHERMGQ